MSFFERLKREASAEWRAYTEHPFTIGMADGTLTEAAFRHYLVQDYLFLIEFARAYAVAVYKSPQLADMREAASGLSAILDVEMNLHVKLCAGWGLSPGDLEQAPPAAEMLAYTRYVLDAGMRGDLLTLRVALAPCVVESTRRSRFPRAFVAIFSSLERATMTGSSTTLVCRQRASPAAMASMTPRCDTIPILTALTSRSEKTASICAPTNSAGTSWIARTPLVFCAVSAVMTDARRLPARKRS